MSDRASGVVKWFNQVQGYGYIDGDDGGEVRVEKAAVDDFPFLTEGLRVSYLTEVAADGTVHAQHVRVVS